MFEEEFKKLKVKEMEYEGIAYSYMMAMRQGRTVEEANNIVRGLYWSPENEKVIDNIKTAILLAHRPKFVETILVFNSLEINNVTKLGLTQVSEVDLDSVPCQQMARATAEYSPQYRQLVASALLYTETEDGLVFHGLRNKSNASEQRLKSTVSMVGGHVNPIEDRGFEALTEPGYALDACKLGLVKELGEEIYGVPKEAIDTATDILFIRYDDDPISREHIGIVVPIEIKNPSLLSAVEDHHELVEVHEIGIDSAGGNAWFNVATKGYADIHKKRQLMK